VLTVNNRAEIDPIPDQSTQISNSTLTPKNGDESDPMYRHLQTLRVKRILNPHPENLFVLKDKPKRLLIFNCLCDIHERHE
jgi:hypothetical protein